MQHCCCNCCSDQVFKYLQLHHTWLMFVAPSAAAKPVYGRAEPNPRDTRLRRKHPTSQIVSDEASLTQSRHSMAVLLAQDVPSTEHMHYAMYVGKHIRGSSQVLRRRRCAARIRPPQTPPRPPSTRGGSQQALRVRRRLPGGQEQCCSQQTG